MSVHLNSQVHKILSFIKKENRSYSFKEVEKETFVSIPTVLGALRSNPKVKVENNQLTYQSEFKIYNREDLINVLLKAEGGIELSRLNDGPINIKNLINIDNNIKNDEFIILKDMDGSEIVFYNERIIEMSNEVKNLWNSIKVPNYHDILSELNASGLKTNVVVKKRSVVKPKKAKKNKRRIKVTNTHVEGLDLTEMNDSDY